MKIITICKNCQGETILKSSANDRAELAMEKGNQFVLQCGHCLKNNEYHIREVKAKSSPYVLVFAILILVLGMGGAFYVLIPFIRQGIATQMPYLFFIFLIPLYFCRTLIFQEKERVRIFNAYRV